MTIHQLRIYEIDPARRDAFHARFRDHAVRIMERHGFSIVAMWEADDDGTVEFVYLLEWPDRETLERQWSAFMGDDEWQQVKQQVRAAIGGEPVRQVSSKVMELTEYSGTVGLHRDPPPTGTDATSRA